MNRRTTLDLVPVNSPASRSPHADPGHRLPVRQNLQRKQNGAERGRHQLPFGLLFARIGEPMIRNDENGTFNQPENVATNVVEVVCATSSGLSA